MSNEWTKAKPTEAGEYFIYYEKADEVSIVSVYLEDGRFVLKENDSNYVDGFSVIDVKWYDYWWMKVIYPEKPKVTG